MRTGPSGTSKRRTCTCSGLLDNRAGLARTLSLAKDDFILDRQDGDVRLSETVEAFDVHLVWTQCMHLRQEPLHQSVALEAFLRDTVARCAQRCGQQALHHRRESNALRIAQNEMILPVG